MNGCVRAALAGVVMLSGEAAFAQSSDSIPTLEQELAAARARILELEEKVAVLEHRERAVGGTERDTAEWALQARTRVEASAVAAPTRQLLARTKAVTETRSSGGAWALMEFQADTREFNTLHVMGSSPLPLGWSVWGFVDFESPDGGADDSRVDAAEFFYEVDLKRPLWNDFGLVLELNDAQGRKNNLTRVGLFYKPQWKLLSLTGTTLSFKLFPYESDGSGQQYSVAFNQAFAGGPFSRFSFGGFVDVNVDAGPLQDHTYIVWENQIRFRLLEGLNLIAELRYNEFLGGSKDFGTGIGVQYRF